MHRLHVISLPHTQTTRAYSACAYTDKVRKFCDMMTARGHQVFLYAGTENEAACAEHIVCATDAIRMVAMFGVPHYTAASFDDQASHWTAFNRRVIAHLSTRLEATDIICCVGGRPQRAIKEAFPNTLLCEFGVGYAGTFSDFRVFESYAWMHSVYGGQAPNADPMQANGRWYDAVIPGFFEPRLFPPCDTPKPRDYVLYFGRMVERKGVAVAAQAAQRAGVKLITAGPGDFIPDGIHEHMGPVEDPAERFELMSGARALLAPSIYVEPFGNVVTEAMACGTPVITTDWGAYTETVNPLVGFRCRTLQEFADAITNADALEREEIRIYAFGRFSPDAVAPQFEAYFDKLAALHTGPGWGA